MDHRVAIRANGHEVFLRVDEVRLLAVTERIEMVDMDEPRADRPVSFFEIQVAADTSEPPAILSFVCKNRQAPQLRVALIPVRGDLAFGTVDPRHARNVTGSESRAVGAREQKEEGPRLAGFRSLRAAKPNLRLAQIARGILNALRQRLGPKSLVDFLSMGNFSQVEPLRRSPYLSISSPVLGPIRLQCAHDPAKGHDGAMRSIERKEQACRAKIFRVVPRAGGLSLKIG